MYKTKKKKEVLEGKEYVKQDLTGFFVENKKKKKEVKLQAFISRIGLIFFFSFVPSSSSRCNIREISTFIYFHIY